MKSLIERFASKKLVVTLLSIIFAGIAAKHPEYKDVLDSAAPIIATYLAGQSVVDYAAKKQGEPIFGDGDEEPYPSA